MKKILKWSLVLLPVLATGCKDDIIPSEPVKPAYSGDDVVFTFANRGHNTRTKYQDNWDDEKKQSIYWGNYLSTDPERITVYCRQAKDLKSAVYQVYANTSGNSVADSVKVDKTTNDGIQWSSQGKDYDFYAFYPAASDLIGDNGYTIQASVETGQMPKQYKTLKNGSNEYKVEELTDIAKNNKPGIENQTTIYAMPDMESAIMMAHTKVSGTPDEANQTGYGYPVSLDFNVLADVLDLTINGPVKPNSLAGNAGEDNTERDYIKIQSIDIQNAKGYNNVLSGNFNIDMTKVTKNANGGIEIGQGAIQIISGSNEVQLSTVDNGQYPTLFVRQTQDKEGAPAANEIDKLRVRVFILPGQVTDLSQLEVVLHTDCGDYTQTLDKFDMVQGAIHPIKLSYFKTRGTEFNYSKWIGQLDENIYISELSIPGSWHSSNTNNQGFASNGKDVVSLEDQYKAGVRAFEVHTTNGTDLKQYHDLTKSFDSTTAEYEPAHIDEKENDPSTPTVAAGSNTEFTTGKPSGILQSTRPVTGTNMTITQTKTVTYKQKPKFSLRLYRTRNVNQYNPNPSESFSDALIALGNVMNADGLMFFEFGHETPTNTSGNSMDRSVKVPYKTVTVTYKRTKENVTLTGTQNRGITGFSDPTANNVTWSNVASKFTDADKWVIDSEKNSYNDTYNLTGGQAWAIAVESCLYRLANTNSTKTGRPILYTEQITANTTIKDVKGHVIAKINTNGDDNEGTYENGVFTTSFWSVNTPALFSRWTTGGSSKPLTINLKWGQPIMPYSGAGTSTTPDQADNALHWCYTELEAVSSIEDRMKAIKAFRETAYNNYKDGKHRTFYECSIGGFLDSNTPDNCKALAKQLNKGLLDVLTDPTKPAAPFGLVFMNYVIAPDNDQENYHSKDLIRTIINNNAAFLLNRRGGSSKNVNDNTNSSFTNNSGDPLK